VDVLRHRNRLSKPDIDASQDPVLDQYPHPASLLQSAANTPSFSQHIKKVVVMPDRPVDVVDARLELPIVQMEQEVMETINENNVVVLCGETGCGKTTQMPQFLYEAGYGQTSSHFRRGRVGICQPRRVAATSTASRVAYELGVKLGNEVGSHVRYSRCMSEKTVLKFMTDGILLREIQNDFLLRQYSVIIVDEAHERSLSTDILLGMLSRIVPLREKMAAEQADSSKSIPKQQLVEPLKLIIMSATLRVSDFVENKRLFAAPPPVIKVPARQFPVSIHFSRRTELHDYVGAAIKKVSAIHKKLPPGGVLVFVTGQREVETMCRKLMHALQPRKKADPCTGYASTDDGESEGNISEEQHAGLEAFSADNLEAFGEMDFSDASSTGSQDMDYNESDESDLDAGVEGLNMGAEDIKHILPDEDHDTAGTHRKEDWGGDNQYGWTDGAGSSPGTEAYGVCSNPRQTTTHEAFKESAEGPVLVLPLYAMLPSMQQRRVFEAPPDGTRLIVVATNVAETSLTIPNIHYVVDTGRAKVRTYERGGGLSRYEIQWVSKASAAQRAGRAGRTGPGHCYRLYSSAHFQNTFEEYAPPEITSAPLEGVVLQMKAMGIDNISNFPFPTLPDFSSIRCAERTLRILGALDRQTLGITKVGTKMSMFPVSPRHSRMLLAAASLQKRPGCQGVLYYALAMAAAISQESPFLSGGRTADDSGSRNDTIEFDENEGGEVLKLKEKTAVHRKSQAELIHPLSDALSVARALVAYQAAGKPAEQVAFCDKYRLHNKTMREMSDLHIQLQRIVFSPKDSPFRDSPELCEMAKMMPVLDLLTGEVSTALRKALCAGWADRVARRVQLSEESASFSSKKRAVRYKSCSAEEQEETIFLHPSSALKSSAPLYVVYTELLATAKRPYMMGATSLEPQWLPHYAPGMCDFSKPLEDPKPHYSRSHDAVMCSVSVTFGPPRWVLPLHPIPFPDNAAAAAVFAAALLEGKVLKALKGIKEHLALTPATFTKLNARGQVRVSDVLEELIAKNITTRMALTKELKRNPKFMYPQLRACFRTGHEHVFDIAWQNLSL